MRDKIVEIGKDSAWYLISTVVSAFIGFIAVPIFTRIFKPDEYGIYSLVATGITLGSPLVFVWLNNAVVRYLPEYERRGELDVLFTTVLGRIPLFVAIIFCFCFPAVLVFAPLGRYRLVVSLGICVFVFYSVFRVLLGFMRAMRLAWQYAVFMIIVQFGRYIVGALLVAKFGMHVEGPFWAWLGTLILLIPAELAILRVWNRVRRGAFSRTLERSILSYGLPLILVNIFSEILTAADRYMVQGIWGSKQVGLYSVVYTLVTNLEAILASIIAMGATPVIVRFFEKEGEEATVTLISRITRYFMMLLVPAMVGIWVLNRRIVSVITSSGYMDASRAIFPLVLGIFISNLQWLPFLSFQIKKRTDASILPIGISAVFNLALNAVLIPLFGSRYGFVGAAWATLASYVLCFILVVRKGRKYMRWEFPWRGSVGIFVSTAVMGVLLFFLDRIIFGRWYGLLVLVIAGTLFYALAMVLTRGFTKSELNFARDLFSRAFAKRGNVESQS